MMHPKVQEYIDKMKHEMVVVKEKEKRDFLIEIGLYEKVYQDDVFDNSDENYTVTEWDNEKNISIDFKKVPIDISDEEYTIIKNLYNQNKKPELIKKSSTVIKNPNNKIEKNDIERDGVAIILKVIACIIYIGGFIAGFVAGSNMTLYFVLGAFISGSIFLGFARIIELLNEINYKQ